MDRQEVIKFFDRCAPTWDAELVKSDAIIGAILDNAEVGEGMDVLDVACGTGVLFPYYLARGVASVTGIDISPEMAKIAAGKTADESRITVLCGDVEEMNADRKFDRIVVYNAFPHFPDPKRLIAVLASMLKDGGRLTVAHGASREVIDNHHKGAARKVSNGLMRADALKRIFDPYLDVEIMISNSRMYQVSGVKISNTGNLHDATDTLHSVTDSNENAPMEEMLALLRYMVDHNTAHGREITALAAKLDQVGRKDAYTAVMEAAAGFEQANSGLASVLRKLCSEY